MSVRFSVVYGFESVDGSSKNFKEPSDEERIIIRK